jgi:hypothetical protein
MVFSKKKNLNYSFILQDKKLEVVETFSYLGIIFKYNGTFFDTKKKLSNFHKSQYNWKIFSDCCIPSFVSDVKTVSSAYNMTNNSNNICNSL